MLKTVLAAALAVSMLTATRDRCPAAQAQTTGAAAAKAGKVKKAKRPMTPAQAAMHGARRNAELNGALRRPPARSKRE